MLVFSEIVSNVLLPYLSFKYYKNENLSELISKIFLYLLIIGCSLFLLFTSFKTKILEVLYTPEYQKAAILVLPFSIVVILRTISSLLILGEDITAASPYHKPFPCPARRVTLLPIRMAGAATRMGDIAQ